MYNWRSFFFIGSNLPQVVNHCCPGLVSPLNSSIFLAQHFWRMGSVSTRVWNNCVKSFFSSSPKCSFKKISNLFSLIDVCKVCPHSFCLYHYYSMTPYCNSHINYRANTYHLDFSFIDSDLFFILPSLLLDLLYPSCFFLSSSLSSSRCLVVVRLPRVSQPQQHPHCGPDDSLLSREMSCALKGVL